MQTSNKPIHIFNKEIETIGNYFEFGSKADDKETRKGWEKEFDRWVKYKYHPKFLGQFKELEEIKSFISKVIFHQKEEIIDELVAEIFIRKDGILPLKGVFIKPNEIREIKKQLKKSMDL